MKVVSCTTFSLKLLLCDITSTVIALRTNIHLPKTLCKQGNNG